MDLKDLLFFSTIIHAIAFVICLSATFSSMVKDEDDKITFITRAFLTLYFFFLGYTSFHSYKVIDILLP